MCGRITSGQDPNRIRERFQVDDWPESPIPLRPRFNVAPATNLSAIVFKNGKRSIEPMKWGLYRRWDRSKPPRFIVNLRADKLARGAFKEGLIKRRCLVPADGFYEWETKQRKKRPVRFTMKDEEHFALPAIYDEPNPDTGPPVRTFTIFTTEANCLVGQYHDRMPAILLPEQEEKWLDPNHSELTEVLKLLQPYPSERMEAYYVSPAVNKATNDYPELISPLDSG